MLSLVAVPGESELGEEKWEHLFAPPPVVGSGPSPPLHGGEPSPESAGAFSHGPPVPMVATLKAWGVSLTPPATLPRLGALQRCGP